MLKKLICCILALAMLVGCSVGAEKQTVQMGAEERKDSQDITYEVRYELGGGTLLKGELVQTVPEGGSAQPPQVQRDGYVFDGWSASPENILADTVIVAQWAEASKITFDANGGTVVSGEAEQWVPDGTIPDAPQVTMEGWELTGWSPGIVAAGGDTTYVAQWKRLTMSTEEIYAAISPAVVEIQITQSDGFSQGLGSGFFIDAQGTVVTNYHVIDGGISGVVLMSDGTSHEILSVLEYDAELDLAVLETAVSGNEFLTISQRDVGTGEAVYAMGSSQGLTGTFSDGIVSQASRQVEGIQCIQITAPISQGNSGGPLVDQYSEVVGVNSMSLTTGQNLNFAIDIQELDNISNMGPITLEELYDETYSFVASQEGGFYDIADDTELEPNDMWFLADSVEFGDWVAGEVSDEQDVDYFSFTIETAGDYIFEVAPYYIDQVDGMLCGIAQFNEDTLEMDVVDVLTSSTTGDYEVSQLQITYLTPGEYYLVVTVDEEIYAEGYPLYYVAQIV